MAHAVLALTSDTRFVALRSCPVGSQALAILAGLGLSVEYLSSPLPFVPKGSVVFHGIGGCAFPSRYLRVLPSDARPGRTADAHLARIATEMGLLRNSRQVIFINRLHADPESGKFEGSHALRFEEALRNLCGMPQRRDRPRPNRRELHEARRRERREEQLASSL